VTDQKKSEQKTEQQPVSSKDATPLQPAAESSDPAVQQLLAERDIATQNGDEEAVKDIDKRLAELGYE
jgi:hypothetical protein